MASIRTHKRKDGSTSFYVLWRDKGTQTSRGFDDESEALRFKEFLDANGQSLTLATKAARLAKGEGPTVAEAVREHIAGLTGVEDRTRDDYRRDLRLHIAPDLGAIKVKQLTRRRVREWVNKQEGSGASAKSIMNRHGLLSAALTTAIEDGVRPDNPAKGIRLPERDRRDDRLMFLEVFQYNLLLEQFPARWRPMVELLAGTGMRWSEATALRVDDIVLDAVVPYVVIDKSWKRRPGNIYEIDRPKSSRSVRDVTVGRSLAGVLAELVDGRKPEEFLMLNASGRGHVTYRNFQGRVWAPAVTRAMTKTEENPYPLRHRPKIHHLRHSHASWLLDEGVDIFAVSRRLGHESITTTTGVYGHLTHRAQKHAAEALDRALGTGPQLALQEVAVEVIADDGEGVSNDDLWG
ncbi:tyrosine integrase [Arthrobacter phage Mufasa8]|uniref:Integrase n=1 Tax=Arthrobacter phage Mufasa8 TaxID=2656526 RepID=A0A649VM42_9CAUD|nr:integrase [Arthrobacter phage Mufasa8]QGJ93476.1 tyrosine integrase [Arthrobacter phage Mufasa8]